jgi:membrane protein implicated in regulation of membrane protease activity
MNLVTIWLMCGMGFLILEMLTGTFVMVFFSLGCFAAALFGILVNPEPQFGMIFGSIIALAGALLLRNPLQKKFLKSITLEADIGKEIQIQENISPHKQARISYQGTTWLATNLDSEDIRQGDHVVIVGIDANVLLIRKSH